MSVHIKNSSEIEKMRISGKILAKVLSHLRSFTQESMSTLDIDIEAEKMIRELGGIPSFKGYKGFPSSICSSINEEVVHTIPKKDKILKNGDIFTIDCGVVYEGLHSDAAITFAIGKASKEIETFINTCKEALYAGIDQIKPGNKIGDISYAIQKVVEKKGYGIVHELGGHGIGYKLHEEPFVSNYGKAGSGLSLKPGMTLAIEPIITYGKRFIKVLDDKWNIVTKDNSLACQYEHTVLVTNNGVEILTLEE